MKRLIMQFSQFSSHFLPEHSSLKGTHSVCQASHSYARAAWYLNLWIYGQETEGQNILNTAAASIPTIQSAPRHLNLSSCYENREVSQSLCFRETGSADIVRGRGDGLSHDFLSNFQLCFLKRNEIVSSGSF
jgi:hypothetical protein